ncbi:LemA family protein [candidate division WOR-1 bacterium RIFOXYB2_FULL_48_7]|uniref:LemA family protein n=1 Tax=candidate division WOR-1 bacterium RIFOXYB2_FULL_48_7 TaxID=1802583 RepID=A0A1F4TTV1_UNCSA|nr:MAG: LemA family protein [candidate division WOR-1 bacterium RIFOXYB2_FULL_48_7]
MWKWIAGIVVVLVLAALWMTSIYNNLVGLDQNAKTAWAQVENQLQRRFDLIPNLVSTVKGYAKHERELLENITKARSAWAGAQTQTDKINAANQTQSFLSRLMVVVENYPQLKANQNFLALQDELAGTENRIATERMRYNQAVQLYNVTARRIPTVFFVRLFGFDPEKMLFEATGEAATAPKVNF